MKWPIHRTLLPIVKPGIHGTFVSTTPQQIESLEFTFVDHSTIFHSANLQGGLRSSETAIEDIFMRRFMTGTFHSLLCSEVIIKRQHNHIRIAALMKQSLPARKMYFLIGYTEELLAYWLQCPVTLELQTVTDSRDVIFKYI